MIDRRGFVGSVALLLLPVGLVKESVQPSEKKQRPVVEEIQEFLLPRGLPTGMVGKRVTSGQITFTTDFVGSGARFSMLDRTAYAEISTGVGEYIGGLWMVVGIKQHVVQAQGSVDSMKYDITVEALKVHVKAGEMLPVSAVLGWEIVSGWILFRSEA